MIALVDLLFAYLLTATSGPFDVDEKNSKLRSVLINRKVRFRMHMILYWCVDSNYDVILSMTDLLFVGMISAIGFSNNFSGGNKMHFG